MFDGVKGLIRFRKKNEFSLSSAAFFLFNRGLALFGFN